MSGHHLNLESHITEAMLENADFLEHEAQLHITSVCKRLGITVDQLEMARRRRAESDSHQVA